jgi:hypothetical protein
MREESRPKAHENDVYWVFCLTSEVDELVAQLHASRKMVEKYDQLRAQNKITPDEAVCLQDEKNAVLGYQSRLRDKLTEAMEKGTGLFRGVSRDALSLGKTLSEILKKLFGHVVPDLYPKLEMGARPLDKDDPERFLKAVDLKALPQLFYGGDNGLGIVVTEGAKFVINTNAEITKEMLKEFVSELQPKVLGQLVEVVFDKMRLAGEAGSLLKIEDGVQEAVALAKKQWLDETELAMDQRGDSLLFTRAEMQRLSKKPFQQGLFDVSEVTDKRFGNEAEATVLSALRDYAQHSGNNYRLQRQLFTDDTERGFAFVDICRQRFDVVLMNPPFGDASLPSKPYIQEEYGDTRGDIYKSFVECFQDRLVSGGMLGMISSRTGFFLGQSTDWRQRIVLRLFRPLFLADFGYGILDAMVETAAYVLRSLDEEEERQLTLRLLPHLSNIPTDRDNCFSIPKYQEQRDLKRHQAIGELNRLLKAGFITEIPGQFRRFCVNHERVKQTLQPQPESFSDLTCFRLISEQDKEEVLYREVQALRSGNASNKTHVINPASFGQVPGSPFAYWVSDRIRRLFQELPPFEGEGRTVKQGLATADDFRFVRVWWEVSPQQICPSEAHPPEWTAPYCVAGYRWFPFAKGGEYSPYYAELHLVVNWERDEEEIRNFVDPETGKTYSRPQNTDFYFRPGLTWPRRTQLGFNLRTYPKGAVFADKGPVAFTKFDESLPQLGLGNSGAFHLLLSLQMAFGSYELGVIQRTPIPNLSGPEGKQLGNLVLTCMNLKRDLDRANETSHVFHLPTLLQVEGQTLTERITAWQAQAVETEQKLTECQREIDDIAFRLYGIDGDDGCAIKEGIEGGIGGSW